MSKKSYIGINNTAHEVKKTYIGIDGVARAVKKVYIGVNGIAKEVWSAAKPLISFTISENGTIKTYQAEEGMTWGEWVESDYNTDGYINGEGYIFNDGYIGLFHDIDYENYITANDIITSNIYYVEENPSI